MTIIAAADGSALGNPGPAGWAWYIDDSRWAAGGWEHGTNNMGELTAVLELLRATAGQPGEELKILCDSQYVINCITKWMPGWKKRGWKKADGKPVLNQGILKELDEELKGRSCSFEWVKGHAGHPLNEAADDRAREAAEAFRDKKAPTAGPGFAPGPAAPAAAPTAEPASAPAVTGSPQPAAAPVETVSTDKIFSLEQAMFDDSVRAAAEEYLAFLHPGFQEVRATGALADCASITAAYAADILPEAPDAVQLLTGQQVGADVFLLAYRKRTAAGGVVCSAWWVRYRGQWKLRFRQETLEQG